MFIKHVQFQVLFQMGNTSILATGYDWYLLTMAEKNYARSICLPTESDFRNLKTARRFAIDIGMESIIMLRINGLEYS